MDSSTGQRSDPLTVFKQLKLFKNDPTSKATQSARYPKVTGGGSPTGDYGQLKDEMFTHLSLYFVTGMWCSVLVAGFIALANAQNGSPSHAEDPFVTALKAIPGGYDEYRAFEISQVSAGFLQTIRGNLNSSFLSSIFKAYNYAYDEFQNFRSKMTVLARELSLFCLGIGNSDSRKLDQGVEAAILEELDLLDAIDQELAKGEATREANSWPEAIQEAAEDFASDDLRMFPDPQQAVSVLWSFLDERYGIPPGDGLIAQRFYVLLPSPGSASPLSRGDVVQEQHCDGAERREVSRSIRQEIVPGDRKRLRRVGHSLNYRTPTLKECYFRVSERASSSDPTFSLTDATTVPRLSQLVFQRTVEAMPFTAFCVTATARNNRLPLFWESTHTTSVLRVTVSVELRLCSTPKVRVYVDLTFFVVL
uniref:Uncharacterized protein n=1 Tax=Steinernema glaseri TaxID=37863 RepID=A0A1I7YV14_9BILA